MDNKTRYGNTMLAITLTITNTMLIIAAIYLIGVVATATAYRKTGDADTPIQETLLIGLTWPLFAWMLPYIIYMNMKEPAREETDDDVCPSALA